MTKRPLACFRSLLALRHVAGATVDNLLKFASVSDKLRLTRLMSSISNSYCGNCRWQSCGQFSFIAAGQVAYQCRNRACQRVRCGRRPLFKVWVAILTSSCVLFSFCSKCPGKLWAGSGSESVGTKRQQRCNPMSRMEILVSADGLEPSTHALKGHCSAS